MEVLKSQKLQVEIEGTLYEIEQVHQYDYLPMLDVGSKEFYIAESHESAGEAARKYWEDLAQDDPKEFTCLVGEETLIAWGLGHYAGPGSTQAQSLNDWLDLWLDTPEEEFAGYDGAEQEVTAMSTSLLEELGWDVDIDDELQLQDFRPVAYRHN